MRQRIKGVKKKISNKHLTDLCERSASYSSTSVLEHLMKSAKEIQDLPGESQDKFDLLLGEVEVALYETYNLFKKKWDIKNSLNGKTDVMDVKRIYGVK